MSYTIKIKDYDQFKCSADACPLSCCQEWRIAVDEDTLNKWQGLKLNATEEGGNKYPELSLCQCVESQDFDPTITLTKDKKCPFLSNKKLCRVVIELGEEYLSETCTTFPRQINKFEDRTEYSLAACCPVVVDMLNMHKGPMQFSKEGKVSQKEDLLMDVREMMICIMEEEKYTLPERMMMTFYALLDILDQKKLTAQKLKECGSESYLHPIASAIQEMPFNLVDSFFERNELFLDIVENYRKQKLYVDYLEDIAINAETLDTYEDEVILEKLDTFEKQLITYQNLLKNYIVADLFGNVLMADMTLEDMVIAFEWVTLEYSVIKQGIFLKWLVEGEKDIEYSMIRDYISVISRVTGYDQEDIREYLANSFEDIIWEWGYLALMLGNGKI